MDDVEITFAADIMWATEMIIPPQEQRRSGQGYSGNTQTEAELQVATDAMHEAWHRLKIYTRDAQVRRTVRHECTWLERAPSAAIVCFFERQVVKLEKQLHMGNQRGLFQSIKSLQLEETKRVEPQYARGEVGRLLRGKGCVRERYV